MHFSPMKMGVGLWSLIVLNVVSFYTKFPWLENIWFSLTKFFNFGGGCSDSTLSGAQGLFLGIRRDLWRSSGDPYEMQTLKECRAASCTISLAPLDDFYILFFTYWFWETSLPLTSLSIFGTVSVTSLNSCHLISWTKNFCFPFLSRITKTLTEWEHHLFCSYSWNK